MNTELERARDILRQHFASNYFGSSAGRYCSGDGIEQEKKLCYDLADEFFNNLLVGIKNELKENNEI